MNSDRVRILFVCHGNICRSTMAQCVMQWLVDKQGLSERFIIDSAATTNEEIGMPIYPPARDKLVEKGVPIVPHRARRVQVGEEGAWDYIVCMDNENVRHLRRILGADHCGKVRKLLSFCGEVGDVVDPWYTRDFEATWCDVLRGCEALFANLSL